MSLEYLLHLATRDLQAGYIIVRNWNRRIILLQSCAYAFLERHKNLKSKTWIRDLCIMGNFVSGRP